MAIIKVAQKYKPKDIGLDTVLGDYRRKINEIIDNLSLAGIIDVVEDGDSVNSARLEDLDGTHYLYLKFNENETVYDRTLNFKVNSAERTIDLSGNLIVESTATLDQDYTSDATVRFAKLGLGMAASNVLDVTGNTGLDGTLTVNEAGVDKDTRIESVNKTHMLFIDASADFVGINESAPVCRFHITGTVCSDYAGVGADTFLLIENDDNVAIQLQAATTGSAYIEFCDNAYNPPAGRVAYDFANAQMEFVIETNEHMWLTATQLKTDLTSIEFSGTAAKLSFTGTAGGNGEGILYKDSGSTNRYGLLFEATNKVVLCNRATNGTVELRANTSTPAVTGEVTVVTVEDTDVTLSDGIGFNLQEDITFTGATTENLIKMPDNLLDALSIQEGSNKYVTFDTVNDEEDIFFYKSVDILHTATHADDHALEIDTDAAMLGDVKAIDLDYITGQIDTGQDEGIILINIDETIADGGDVFGLEVLSTDGSANIYGMKVGAVINPIIQDSGTFANPTLGTDNHPSTNVPNMIDGTSGGGSTTAIFEANNEYIIIGADVAFQEIELIFTTVSSKDIKPTFWYSINGGSDNFTQFTPVDGTDGCRHTGVIAWDASDLSNHVADDTTGKFDIKIIRTKGGSFTTPVLGYAKTATTVEYVWNKDGDVSIRNLVASGTLGVTGVATLATGSTIGNLTLANGSITDSSNAIDFGNENLSTTGTLGCGIFTITANSDSIIFTPDGSDAYVQWSDGSFVFLPDEGTNTDGVIKILGKGTGRGQLRIYDEDGSTYFKLTASNNQCYFDMAGNPTTLNLISGSVGTANIWCFPGITAGNPTFGIYGWDSGSSSRKYGTFAINSAGNLEILADDGAISFGNETLSTTGVVSFGAITTLERGADPTQPAEGECVIWMSDGTGKGDDGDLMVASTAGGTTNYGTLFDHSGGAGW